MVEAIVIAIVIIVVVAFVGAVKSSRELKDFNKMTGHNFTPTKRILGDMSVPIAEFDDIIKKCRFHSTWSSRFCSYSDIVSFELLEDGVSKISGGLGTAVLGGVLFGGVGAVVGGITSTKTSRHICKSIKVKITVNNMSDPVIMLTFLDSPNGVESDSAKYKNAFERAHECLSVLQLICNQQNQVPIVQHTQKEVAQPITSPLLSESTSTSSSNSSSTADEIRKLKDLVDSGVLSEEEFTVAKRNILGL